MNPKIDLYLEEGCGRCDKYRTMECKVHTWQTELLELRRIVLECGLKEDFKWSQPCYTFNGNNILIVTALKNYAVLGFFKGVLLEDSHKILIAAGKNSQSVRQIHFTNTESILKLEPILKSYIYEAVEVERAGLKVNFVKRPANIPEELKRKFIELPELKSAFEQLTPGRQRGYLIYFSQAKQSKTRVSRIEKYVLKILSGKGLNDK